MGLGGIRVYLGVREILRVQPRIGVSALSKTIKTIIARRKTALGESRIQFRLLES